MVSLSTWELLGCEFEKYCDTYEDNSSQLMAQVMLLFYLHCKSECRFLLLHAFALLKCSHHFLPVLVLTPTASASSAV